MQIKDRVKAQLPIEDFSSYFVVADFDKTITTGSSKTSWSILADSNLVPEEYVQERNAYYDTYRPIEANENLDLEFRKAKVKEWFRLHIELFIKYKLSEEVFEKAASDLRIMEFRKGAKEFLDRMHEEGVPVIIISAGIGNFIETFLKKNGCFHDNIFISSNKIIFENGVASRIGANIVHSLNKNEVSLPEEIKAKIAGRSDVILLGDQPSDLLMVDETAHRMVLKIGFLTDPVNLESYERAFDVVVEEPEDYTDLNQMLIRKEKRK